MPHPGLFESDCLKDQELLEHHRTETRHLSSLPEGLRGMGMMSKEKLVQVTMSKVLLDKHLGGIPHYSIPLFTRN